MTGLESPKYPNRTLENILNSDATLMFTVGKISGGTALTLRRVKEYRKPYLHINLKSKPEEKAVQIITSWLRKVMPEVLNIAGSREGAFCAGMVEW